MPTIQRVNVEAVQDKKPPKGEDCRQYGEERYRLYK